MTITVTPCRLLSEAEPPCDVRPGTESSPEFLGVITVEGVEIVLGFRVILDDDEQEGEVFFRPKDFEQARDLVLDTEAIGKRDKHALLDLLLAMEDDDNLYLRLNC